MRSTRAAAAVARLNGRSDAPRYRMIATSTGLFKLSEQIGGSEQVLGAALELDAFVRFVDSLGPQKVRRITKSDAAFAKQLVRKAKP